MRPADTVAVIVTTYNSAEYLDDALRSIMSQQCPVDEIIVVDDGSDISPAAIVNAYPKAVLIRKPNGGLSSARNAGLHASSSKFVIFLDDDDRLTPQAVETGLACFAGSPAAGMVYGGHRRIDREGKSLGSDVYNPLGLDAYGDLLKGNRIGMHATVLYRREILDALGGFNESLAKCEDYDLYLRLARDYSVASHADVVAEYRWHGANISRNTTEMLKTALAVLDLHPAQTPEHRKAKRSGRKNWKLWYTRTQHEEWDGKQVGNPLSRGMRSLLASTRRALKRRLKNGRVHALLNRLRGNFPPPVGHINFGDLGTTTPISMDFGWDRGTPIDRYYVAKFLQEHSADVRGRVLEIGDDSYSRQFGGERITQQDVLHLKPGHPKATLYGDLTQPGVLPEDAFDCIILTQTLQLILDMREAVKRLHAALRPGGVLLLTVPGISAIDRFEWRTQWSWAFTTTSLRWLLEQSFPPEAIAMQNHGNVFAAITSLQGIVVEDIDPSKLDRVDPAYPVTLVVRAERRQG